MGAFENFALGLHAGACMCHFWQGSGTHKLPSNAPTLMLEMEKCPFAPCFLSNPRLCILCTCGEELWEECESV